MRMPAVWRAVWLSGKGLGYIGHGTSNPFLQSIGSEGRDNVDTDGYVHARAVAIGS